MKPRTKKESFISLYQKEADSVYRFCLMRVSDTETAIDLSQEAFLKFWDYLSNGEKIRNEKAFLFRIARNLVIDHYRKKKSISLEGLTANVDGDENLPFQIEDTTVDILFETEAKVLLEKLKEIQPMYQEVIYLRFVEGLKPKEIAETLGQSANAVSVRLTRALEELKNVAGYEVE